MIHNNNSNNGMSSKNSSNNIYNIDNKDIKNIVNSDVISRCVSTSSDPNSSHLNTDSALLFTDTAVPQVSNSAYIYNPIADLIMKDKYQKSFSVLKNLSRAKPNLYNKLATIKKHEKNSKFKKKIVRF